jgi:type II secretory pathway component PulF
MAQFKYTILDASGKRVTQVMRSTTKQDVAQYLSQQGYYVINIQEQSGRATKLAKQLKPSDKITFTQNLGVLLSSGISLGEAVSIIAEDTEDKSVSAFYQAILADLERGHSFSKALAQYPLIFDPIYISLVEAGENSGKLEVVMDNLAKSIQKDVRTLQQVKSALMYPAFVLASLFILGALITFFVLPRITKIFESLNVELPFMTRMLVWFSNFVSNNTVPLLIGMFLCGVGAIFLLRSQRTKRFMSKAAVRLPVIKQVIHYLDLSRLSSTLSLLLNAGIPIQQAIAIASGTVKNPQLNQEFRKTADDLAAGKSLAASLQETSLPKTFISLVSVGERSGNISNVFTNLAEHYEELLDTAVKNFTGILEPVLTLVVGLIVGGVVITVMVPLYQFIGNLEAVQ